MSLVSFGNRRLTGSTHLVSLLLLLSSLNSPISNVFVAIPLTSPEPREGAKRERRARRWRQSFRIHWKEEVKSSRTEDVDLIQEGDINSCHTHSTEKSKKPSMTEKEREITTGWQNTKDKVPCASAGLWRTGGSFVAECLIDIIQACQIVYTD